MLEWIRGLASQGPSRSLEFQELPGAVGTACGCWDHWSWVSG